MIASQRLNARHFKHHVWNLFLLGATLCAFSAQGSTKTDMPQPATTRPVQGEFESDADRQALQQALSKSFGSPVTLRNPTDNAATGAGSQDRFGVAVALSGSTAIVGAHYHNTPAGTAAGAAYVFVRTGVVWNLQAKLTADDGASDDHFGITVAVLGDTALVGNYQDDNLAGVDAGAAFVFTRTGGLWTQQAKLTALDGMAADQFGISVALAADTALVGAWTNDTPAGIDSGSAYVFVRNGSVWSQQALLIGNDTLALDEFGKSVALSGATALIGAHRHDTSAGIHAGSAYVFTRSGALWTQQARLSAGDAMPDDQFGISVALSGNTALVGAHEDDSPSATTTGSAYVFARNGTLWNQQAKLTAADSSADDYLGYAVALSGDVALLGAYGYSAAPSAYYRGAAYVFRRAGTIWTEQNRLNDSPGDDYDFFGSSVAVSNGVALVGVPLDDSATTGNVEIGSVRVYTDSDLIFASAFE